MAPEVHVVEDGVGSPPDNKRSQPSWVLGAVGFALGLGLGVLVVGSTGAETPDPVPTTAAVDQVAAPESTVGTVVADLGVAAVVDDFPDAIVAIARTPSSALNHVLWPRGGEIRVRPMSGGENVVLDVTSQFIAMSDGIPGLDGALLSMGRFNSIRPIATAVISYAWHDSRNALLSYTELAGESTRLLTVQADLEPDVVTELSSAGAAVVGWGDWGWAIQQPDEIVLLNAEGEFRDSEPGIAYATHPSGWIFAIEDTGAKLVTAGGGVKRMRSHLGVGDVVGAAFSPDGDTLAVGGTRGLVVVDIESEAVRRLSDFFASSVSWSSDSRFVLIPNTAGVVVFDLENPGTAYPILRTHPSLAVGSVPLRSS